jgi:hypothetical protein
MARMGGQMSRPVKVIARIRGRLGNQLFCYAAARRLAVANDAELVIDDVTGLVRDSTCQFAVLTWDVVPFKNGGEIKP